MVEQRAIKILKEGRGPLLTAPDVESLREHNRKKDKRLRPKVMTEEEAVEKFVRDGQYIGFELYGSVRAPMSLVRAIIRSGKKDFSMVGQGVHETDLMLAAGIVKELDFTYMGEEVYGVSHIVRRACEPGGCVERVVEWSNAALTWRFKAAAMGVPFLPTISMLGSDTLEYSGAKVIECPFTGRPVALLPALVLDVAFIHVSRADEFGNCQIDGIWGFAYEMARAAKTVVVSCEELVPTDVIRSDPSRTVIPYFMVDAVVHAPFGSWPGEMAGMYERDKEHYEYFLEMAKTKEGADRYLEEWVYGVENHRALLEKVGKERLESLRLSKSQGG